MFIMLTYFAQVGGRSTDDIDLEWEKEFDDNKFYWNYVTPMDINKVSLMRSSAVDSDGVSPRLLKLMASRILSVIEHIFNFIA